MILYVVLSFSHAATKRYLDLLLAKEFIERQQKKYND